MAQREDSDDRQPTFHQDPAVLQKLLSDPGWSMWWLLPRVYAGWVLLNVGWPLTRSAEWMQRDGALRLALSQPSEQQPWAQPATGLHAEVTSLLVSSGAVDWISKLTAVGITLAGIALILGLLSGAAAFTGIVLSGNLLVAGATEPGPVIIAIAILLVLGWKTAGWIGLDRWVLPALGAPWGGSSIAQQRRPSAERLPVNLEITD